MKKSLLGLAVMLVSSLLFIACNDKSSDLVESGVSEKYSVGFNVDFPVSQKAFDANQLEILTSCDISAAVYIIVSVEENVGGDVWEEVITDQSLNITHLETGHATDLIELPPGDYRVSKFVVTDAEGLYVMATPEEESEFAGYMSSDAAALPVYFDIATYDKDRLSMEVLCFEAVLAPEFGFQWFDITIELADFMCFFVNVCDPTDPDNYHQVLSYNAKIWTAIKDGEEYTPDVQYYEDVNVVDGDPQILCFPLAFSAFENGVFVHVTDYSLEKSVAVDTLVYISAAEISAILLGDPAYYHLIIDCDDVPPTPPFEECCSTDMMAMNGDCDYFGGITCVKEIIEDEEIVGYEVTAKISYDSDGDGQGCGLSHFTIASATDIFLEYPDCVDESGTVNGNNVDGKFLNDLDGTDKVNYFGFKQDSEGNCIDDLKETEGEHEVTFEVSSLGVIRLLVKTGQGNEDKFNYLEIDLSEVCDDED